MKSSVATKKRQNVNQLTIGIDLGDRWGHYCILDEHGEVLEEGRVPMTRKALTAHFSGVPARIAMEAGAYSAWISEHLSAMGHEVIVANARELRAISGSNNKNDRADAEKLARFARVDPKILRPIQHRSLAAQKHLTVIRARAAAVRARSLVVNAVRGLVKPFGCRLTLCSTAAFPSRHHDSLPDELRPALEPLLATITELSIRIKGYDKQIVAMSETLYPDTHRLREVHGVGPLTALTFILTLEDKQRFQVSRDVGCFLGLRPRQYQSGSSDPQLHITKAGDVYLRTLLVECAQHILGPFGTDSAIRRWGLSLVERGGKIAKRRATIAVARKLAVLLHRIWVTDEPYQPFYGLKSEPQTA
jgi:transposase